MADQPDQAQRTEEPTPKRLEEARKKGDSPKSQEVTAAAMLGAGTLGLWLLAGPAANGVAAAGAPFLDRPHEFIIDADAMRELFAAVAFKLGAALSGAAILIVAVAILANVVQARPVFTTVRMKPQLSKISPIAGFKRVFGTTGLVNFLKGVGKLIIVGAILIFALWPDRTLLTGLVHSGRARAFADRVIDDPETHRPCGRSDASDRRFGRRLSASRLATAFAHDQGRSASRAEGNGRRSADPCAAARTA